MTLPISLFRVSFLALILFSSSVIFAYNPPPQPPSGHTPNHPVAAAPAQSTAATAVSHGGPINTTYTHNASEYGVQCITSDPSWDQHINVSSCNSNIVEMCDNIAAGTAIVSQWNWSSGGPNCTVGIWFNPPPAAQPSRSYTQCKTFIYQLMATTCFSSPGKGPFNVAAVNLRTLPDERTNGSQVDRGYPSYIMVPETYDDIYLDSEAGGGGSDGGGGEERVDGTDGIGGINAARQRPGPVP